MPAAVASPPSLPHALSPPRPTFGRYAERNTDGYKAELGLLVANVCRAAPGGVLVFFASYGALDACVEHWRTRGQWEQIARHKAVVVEPRGAGAGARMSAAIAEYDDALGRPGGGGVFLAVCRGKASEGLDFADARARFAAAGARLPSYYGSLVGTYFASFLVISLCTAAEIGHST